LFLTSFSFPSLFPFFSFFFLLSQAMVLPSKSMLNFVTAVRSLVRPTTRPDSPPNNTSPATISRFVLIVVVALLLLCWLLLMYHYSFAPFSFVLHLVGVWRIPS
jgi:hypothetical protein